MHTHVDISVSTHVHLVRSWGILNGEGTFVVAWAVAPVAQTKKINFYVLDLAQFTSSEVIQFQK